VESAKEGTAENANCLPVYEQTARR
jgi:hypothetical protein